jgi:AcrR family transcriptional regulator
VTAQNSQRPYHHGNLRAELLAAAVEEIQNVGTAGLSLRMLARRAGVSHAAPAHHFTDKRGLFTALAAEGFQMLHRRTRRALRQPDALLATGRCYIGFALDHPAHFDVMFDTSVHDPADADLARERNTAFEVLYQALRQGTGTVDDAEVATQAVAAWVLVHGVATLWLTGNLPYPRKSRYVDRALRDLVPAILPVVRTGAQQLERKAVRPRTTPSRTPSS